MKAALRPQTGVNAICHQHQIQRYLKVSSFRVYDEMDKRVNMKAVPQVQGINMWCSASICQKCQEHIILESVFTFKMGFLTIYLLVNLVS